MFAGQGHKRVPRQRRRGWIPVLCLRSLGCFAEKRSVFPNDGMVLGDFYCEAQFYTQNLIYLEACTVLLYEFTCRYPKTLRRAKQPTATTCISMTSRDYNSHLPSSSQFAPEMALPVSVIPLEDTLQCASSLLEAAQTLGFVYITVQDSDMPTSTIDRMWELVRRLL